MKINTTLSMVKWDEHSYQILSETMQLTKASVIFESKEELCGTLLVEYLMMYTHADKTNPQKGVATYVGLMHFAGTLHGKQGQFVLENKGIFQNGEAIGTINVIPLSGTDQLQKIVGSGTFMATHHGVRFELDYQLSQS